MKKVGIILSLVFIAAISCKEEKKNAGAEAGNVAEIQPVAEMAEASFSSEKTDLIFSEYQQLRVALVASDGESARGAAGRLADALGDGQGELSSVSNSIASADGLEEQRTIFSELTALLDPLFRQELVEGEIFQQYCPMAFEGKGGYWISDKEEIRNPYYGDRMLTCGKVSEIIKR